VIPVRVGAVGPQGDRGDGDDGGAQSTRDEDAAHDRYVPPIDPRTIAPPSKEIFAALGEEAIMAMVCRVYDALAGSAVAHLFPPPGPALDRAAERSGAFFVGLLGGPPRYHERYGNPMMRARHLSFAIGLDERNVWLSCWDDVLNGPDRPNLREEHHVNFRAFLDGFSLWMTNKQ
jgi:hemoglobin